MECLDDERIDLNLIKSDLNILYFGSKTHQEDLDFILNVITAVNRQGGNSQLSVVGCGDVAEEFETIVNRLTPPDARYDQFVNWLTKIAHNFDLGVAPLVNDEFAKSKSPLKALEFCTIKIPVLCSNNLPYSALKNIQEFEAENITYIDNENDLWVDTILNRKYEVK
jgi:hypothetical protein